MIEYYVSEIEDKCQYVLEDSSTKYGYVCSPMNYIGGKYKLLSQLLPLFPKKIKTFIDLFCGGCNVGINVQSEKIIFNDNLSYLIDLYKEFQSLNKETIITHVENRIKEFNLSLTNEEGYKNLRCLYNTHRNPIDLFVLVAYSFNHQIRFNSSHEFNNPFGRERSSFNDRMKNNLSSFINTIHNKNVEFFSYNFDKFIFSNLSENDFVYCDPPYLITKGTYNDGKRGFTGWSHIEEKKLLDLLVKLNNNKIKFGLSNVLIHKGKQNHILIQWINSNNFYVTHLDKNYSNSNYHTKDRDKNSTDEVLITNYHPIDKQLTLKF